MCLSLVNGASNPYCPGCVESQAIAILSGEGYVDMKQMDCFVGSSCSYSSKYFSFTRPPCGLSYFIAFDAQPQYCSSSLYSVMSGKLYMRYGLSAEKDMFKFDVPCTLQPPSPPAPSPLQMPSSGSVFGHSVVLNIAELRSVIAQATSQRGGSAVATVVSTVAGSGATSGFADGTGATARFKGMNGVALTADGSILYVAGRYNHRIRKVIISTGVVTTLAGSGTAGSADGAAGTASFKEPAGLALTSDGAFLYVSGNQDNAIRKVSTSSGAVSTVASVARSYGLVLTSDGAYIYASSLTTNKILRIVTSTGAVTTFAGSGIEGSADGAAGDATFKAPIGLALTSDDAYLYVGDYGNHKIRIIATSTGVVTTFAGSGIMGSADGAAGTATFDNPYQMAITSDNAIIYIADRDNHKIRRITTSNGAVATVAGTGVGGSTDGAAETATFGAPIGVALTADDSVLYVSTQSSYSVRKISSALPPPPAPTAPPSPPCSATNGGGGSCGSICCAIAVHLNAGVTLALGGTSLVLNNLELSLRSEGLGATIDAGGLSRAFEVWGEHGHLKLYNIHVINGQASRGGGVLLSQSARLHMEASTISDCKAIEASSKWRSAYGGGLALLLGSTATLLDSTIRRTTAENTQTGSGNRDGGSAHSGAVHVEGGTLVLIHSTIEESEVTATYALGGAVTVSNGRMNAASNSSISHSKGTALDARHTSGYMYGGCIAATEASIVELEDSRMEGCQAIAGWRAFGGAMYLRDTAKAIVKATVVTRSTAKIFVPGYHDNPCEANGGAFYVFSTSELKLSDQTVVSDSEASTKGGGIFAEGSVLVTNASKITNCVAPLGSSMYVQGGALVGLLPVPPAHWIPAVTCEVSRTRCAPLFDFDGVGSSPCVTKSSYNLNNAMFCACYDLEESCRLDTSASPAYPITYRGQSYSYTCAAQTGYQPCNWLESPHLLGENVMTVGQGAMDMDFPFACSPGLVGSDSTLSMSTPLCDGPCPAGSFCPMAGTVTPTPCPPGHYCPAGSAQPLLCPAGSYSGLSGLKAPTECTACPSGHYCTPGSVAPTVCSPGSYAAFKGSHKCGACDPGSFQDEAAAVDCKQCSSGNYCPLGAAAERPCNKGTWSNSPNLGAASDCTPCPKGHACPTGSTAATPCAPGTHTNLTQQPACAPCDAGTFQALSGQTFCDPCTEGYYCSEAAAAALPCPGGTHKNQSLAIMTSADQCVVCPRGAACSVGSKEPTLCLPGSFAADAGQETCTLCDAAKYQERSGKTDCAECTRGFYCATGAATPTPCPGGTTSNLTGASSKASCKPVTSGFWAPLGSALPEDCPTSGFFCPGAAEDEVNHGSKPIIIPVGGSTTTEQVESVQKELVLALSCSDFNLAAVKQSLAVQYNVPVALVTLSNPCTRRRTRARALQGQLSLTITIASSGTAADGTSVSAPVADLLTAVQSVNDATLGSTIGTALSTTVTVTSTAPSQKTLQRAVSFVCPKGKWCTAGLVVDCTAGTYNPLTGQDLGTACKPCPEFSTSPVASTSRDDCVCQDGFIQTIFADGTARCECEAGYEILNGVRCDQCQPGTYKPEAGNSKCFDCRSSPLLLAAKEFTTTISKGASAPTDCVCKAGYYLKADAISGQASCKPCGNTWFQGRPGTNCSEPGVTLATLPILAGFYRQSLTSEVVRKCINIDAEVACRGSGNLSTRVETEVVTTTLALDVTAEQFNAPKIREELATLYGVLEHQIALKATAGSLNVEVTISPSAAASQAALAGLTDGSQRSADAPPAPPALSIAEVIARVNSVDAAALRASLGKALGSGAVGVSVGSPAATAKVNTTVVTAATGCSPGYSGPYCAVCAKGYFGGGDGKECMLCTSAGNPTVTVLIQASVALAVLVVGTLLIVKFGRKGLQKAQTALVSSESGFDNLAAVSGADASEEGGAEGEEAAKLSKRERVMKKVAAVIGTFGVKVKILVSLFQVLNGLGVIFSIPYPDSYNDLMQSVSVIQLDVPTLLPLDCLFGGLNFFHTLVVQTLVPLVLVVSLNLAAAALKKASTKVAAKFAAEAKAEGTEPKEPIGPFLGELFSTVAFFLLFLLYPGSSTKVFHAFMCNSFNGLGEDGQTFLRMDFSIDCDSLFYIGVVRPYAIIMMIIYPIGVPFWFALTLFRNKEQLNELQHLELSIYNERNRAKLGRYLEGKQRRLYQPEIDEAEEREAELTATYTEKRNALPGTLKKLTNGYEMRTYGFEIFECARKMLLILVPIFMEDGSPQQVMVGLIICFMTFGMYMMYAPFEDDGDDFLSQVCQLQIFFSLLSSIVLKADPHNELLASLLPFLIAVPPLVACCFELGLIDAMKTCVSNNDDGVPIPCTGGVRVGRGLRAKLARLLERLLGVKKKEHDNDDDDDDDVAMPMPRRASSASGETMASIPPAVISSFKRFDKNNNNALEYRELKSALSYHGVDVSHPFAAELIEFYDDRPDGHMTLDEYAHLLENVSTGMLRYKAGDKGTDEAAAAKLLAQAPGKLLLSTQPTDELIAELLGRNDGQSHMEAALKARGGGESKKDVFATQITTTQFTRTFTTMISPPPPSTPSESEPPSNHSTSNMLSDRVKDFFMPSAPPDEDAHAPAPTSLPHLEA